MIDRRPLRLFSVGNSQLISGRTRIPEVSAKNRPCAWLYWSTGKNGEYGCRCAVRLPARKRAVPGYAIIVRLTEGIGPLKPAYGRWQDAQASFLLGEMFLSKSITRRGFLSFSSGILKDRRLTRQSGWRQGVPSCSSPVFDDIDFP